MNSETTKRTQHIQQLLEEEKAKQTQRAAERQRQLQMQMEQSDEPGPDEQAFIGSNPCADYSDL